MIGYLLTRVHMHQIIVLYFEFETVLKFYNLEARPDILPEPVFVFFHAYSFVTFGVMQLLHPLKVLLWPHMKVFHSVIKDLDSTFL